MNVAELFRKLSYGELSNLSLAESGAGTIKEEQHPKLILYLNSGLTRLHSRFVLRENSLLLQPFKDKYTYHIHAGQPYIIDTPENPYQDDLIRVLRVYGYCGKELPLNDQNNLNSVFTPQPKVLQLKPHHLKHQVSIAYQATHPLIQEGDLEAEVHIPLVLEDALTAFIAHKVFSHMNGQENNAKAREHLATFDTTCSEVVATDLVSNSLSSTNTRFKENGWV